MTIKEQLEAAGPKLKLRRMSGNGAQMLLQNVRILWPYIAKPSQGRDGIAPAYSVTAMIPKKHLKAIQEELKKVCAGLLEGKKYKPVALKRAMTYHENGSLLKDGDKQRTADDQPRKECQGHALLRATSKVDEDSETGKPKFPFDLKDRTGAVIPEHRIADEFYGGAWCDLAITLRPYNTAGNVGVACFFNGAQKLANDERLGFTSAFAAREDLTEDETEAEFAGVSDSEFED